MLKIAVTGGSSPFTAGLVDAILPHVSQLPHCELAFHGRDTDALQHVSGYAETRLTDSDWSVTSSCDLAHAVHQADIVIHQIRYGGLELRRLGEQLCASHGCLADETLGPAALLTGLLSYGPLRGTCEIIRNEAPSATVVNLTNPLSVTTLLMNQFGISDVVGICELPEVTAGLVAQCLSVPLDELDWQYAGLNHRGFVHSVSVAGEDAIPALVDRLGSNVLGGVTASTISGLHAIPTKYFPLFAELSRNVGDSQSVSRSGFLQELRREILVELKRDKTHSPPSLKRRYLEWYPKAVVPLLLAMTNTGGKRCIVNTSCHSPTKTPVVCEGHAMVSHSGIEFTAKLPPNAKACEWIERFETHERAIVTGLVPHPSRDWIIGALTLDPTVHQNINELGGAIYHLTQETPAQQ